MAVANTTFGEAMLSLEDNFVQNLRRKNGLWWRGGFIGDLLVFSVFRDGNLW
jgi:hypothetical protein